MHCPRPHAQPSRIKAPGTAALELVRRRQHPADSGLMARPTDVYTIEYVATLTGDNLELLQEVASNSDNIDHGVPMTEPRKASPLSPNGASRP